MNILSRVSMTTFASTVTLAATVAVIATGPADAASAEFCAPGTSQVHSVSTASSVVRICQNPSGAFIYRGTLRESGHTGVFPASYERVRGYYLARNHGYYYMVWRNAIEVRDPDYAPVSYERGR